MRRKIAAPRKVLLLFADGCMARVKNHQTEAVVFKVNRQAAAFGACPQFLGLLIVSTVPFSLKLVTIGHGRVV